MFSRFRFASERSRFYDSIPLRSVCVLHPVAAIMGRDIGDEVVLQHQARLRSSRGGGGTLAGSIARHPVSKQCVQSS